jgi:hypothetical protein
MPVLERNHKNSAISPNQFAKYVLGLDLYPKQQEILNAIWCTGVSHAVMCLGRRSGKTLIAVISALYAGLILHRHYKARLGARKYYVIYLVSNSLKQSRMILRIMGDILTSDYAKRPQLAFNGRSLFDFVLSVQTDKIALKNGCVFLAIPASSRGVRGEAAPIILYDEIAFTLNTSGNSAGDSLYAALTPSTAQFGEYARVIMLSSPWIDSGIFYDFYVKGNDPNHKDVIAFQYPTWEVNPTISHDFLALEKSRNPTMYDIEYGAQFAMGATRFIRPDMVMNAIDKNREFVHYARPLEEYKYCYSLALDPAKGGANRDDYVACLCHYEYDEETQKNILVVDFWYEFDANLSIGEGSKNTVVSGLMVADWVKSVDENYGLDSCQCDQYNSLTVIEQLYGDVNVKEFTWSEKTQTVAFRNLAELFIGDRIRIPDDKKAISQICGLREIRKSKGFSTFTGGNQAGVDDYCFALAMAALHAPKADSGI